MVKILKEDIMQNKFVVIDGNSLAFRAFYGLPPLYNSEKEPCNAIFGFFKMLINVIQKIEPKYLVVAFDAGKHNFRHNIYADYKGTRGPTPDDLRAQLQPIKDILKEMNIKVVEIPEIEADDIIGSVARKFDGEMILVSGDRDLFQLINERTTLWLNVKGISDILELDIPALKEKYGVDPSQVIDMKAIMGDTSDNIPGVKGIGPKTALKLIENYSTLDGIYEHINEITGKTQQMLIECKDLAYISKTLATIKTDVELDFEKEDCLYDFPFNKNVYNIMSRYDFRTIIQKTSLFDLTDTTTQQQTTFEEKYLETFEDFLELIGEIKERKEFSLYMSQLSTNIAVDKTEYVLSNFITSNLEFYTYLGDILKKENIKKVIYDVKSYKHYFDKCVDFTNTKIDIKNYFDVSLAIYIVNEGDSVPDFEKYQVMKALNEHYPACNLLNIKRELQDRLLERNQLDLYNNIELKLVEVLYDMEVEGIKIDVEEIKSLSLKYKKEEDELIQKIISLAGKDFNVNSPKQLQAVLFEDLKLQYKGKKSTNVDVLEAIADQHEIVPYILRYRKISKIVSTYLDGMLQFVTPDNFIHTTYLQTFTSTGRLSSRDPNLQNIPVRDEESKVLRKLFMSRFDSGSIMSADYNQIELRLMAIMSKDKNLLNDFTNKVDVHSMTASKIFNVKPEDVTPQNRRVAKAVNFGIIYGISEYGLSKNINTTAKEAKEFIEKYFELYPGVKNFMEESVNFAKENGFTKTLYNRMRHIPELNSTNYMTRMFGERVALNMPLQGTASDIIKIAMIKVQEKMKENNVNSKLILQIHDELIIDVYPGEEEQISKILKDCMTSVVNFELPLEVAVSYGKTWYDTK